MRKMIVVLLVWMAVVPAVAQATEDLFGSSDKKITLVLISRMLS